MNFSTVLELCILTNELLILEGSRCYKNTKKK